MSHKTLKRKSHLADQKVTKLGLELYKLSTGTLTKDGRERLPAARKTTHKAIQYATRLRRRLAKAIGAENIPSLSRASFNRTCEFRRLQKSGGFDVAMAHLLLTSA